MTDLVSGQQYFSRDVRSTAGGVKTRRGSVLNRTCSVMDISAWAAEPAFWNAMKRPLTLGKQVRILIGNYVVYALNALLHVHPVLYEQPEWKQMYQTWSTLYLKTR